MRRLLLPLLLLLGLGPEGQPQPLPPSGAQCLEHDCFGIFWGSHPFAEASAECERGGGHLMTVRSTVAEDAIALLVQNRSGRLWLGLRLPQPCTDPAQRLRGFQWVTGDGRTDYANWEPSTGRRRCGDRCVTVSRELRWEEQKCEEPADGFLCEYNYGGSCPRLPPVEGLLVTYTTPFGALGGDFLALPPGSLARIPSMGLELRCSEGGDGGGLRWSRDHPPGGAWPCRLANGGCEGTCEQEEEGGQPRCSCPDGKVLAPDGRGCGSPCAGAPCQHHCVVAGSGFICMCEAGYRLAADGSSCEDVDDCALEPGLCEQLCVNTEGAFECRCHSGYEMLEGRCRPVSPCYRAPCEQHCEEVPEGGGYLCGCFPGYAVDPRDPSRCLLHCNSSQCQAQCDPFTLSCECPDGFVLDEDQRVCVDLDECDMNYCPQNCTNHPGGYQCHCQDGYYLHNQNHCVEIPLIDEDGESSGDFGPQSPVPTRTPPAKVEPLHPGVLVGITLGALCTALALLALGYCLAKRCCSPPATMDYKCSSPHEKEMGLHPVSSSCATSGQKL
ncbi:thrombomodulin [Calypte anna]|uniref:thrombomodulin n=1 Tax=Calypte anna TaxID=9244 RepID=UPI0011C3AB5E|nr:thrombomodulin [Calypte anna]